MTNTFFEIDCGEDEPVMLEITANGDYIFHGWDHEAERAAIELGFEPTYCVFIWSLLRRDRYARNRQLASQANYGAVLPVKILLAAGADVNAHGYRRRGKGAPLREATASGHTDVVRVLLEHGADVNVVFAEGEKWFSAIDTADRAGHHDVVEFIERWIEEHG